MNPLTNLKQKLQDEQNAKKATIGFIIIAILSMIIGTLCYTQCGSKKAPEPLAVVPVDTTAVDTTATDTVEAPEAVEEKPKTNKSLTGYFEHYDDSRVSLRITFLQHNGRITNCTYTAGGTSGTLKGTKIYDGYNFKGSYRGKRIELEVTDNYEGALEGWGTLGDEPLVVKLR